MFESEYIEITKNFLKKLISYNYNLGPIVPLILLFIFYLFYYQTSSYLVPFSSDTWEKQDLIYGSDTVTGFNLMKQFTFPELRHFLFSALTSPVVNTIKLLFNISITYAISIVTAMIATINVVLAYYALNLFINDKKLVTLFSIFYGFLFSNLVFFSIPETYALTNLAILLTFNCLIRLVKNNDHNWFILLILAIILSSLLNPPTILLVIPSIFIFLNYYNLTRGMIRSFLCVSTTLLVFVVSYVLAFGINFYMYFAEFANTWCPHSINNYLDIDKIINVFGSFVVLSVISPSEKISNSMNFSQDFLNYFDSTIGAYLILFYIVILGLFLYYIVKTRDIIRDSSLIFILFMALFYLYLNPREALLYSCQVLFPLTLVFADITNRINFSNKYIFLIVFIIFMAIKNVSTLYHPIL
ncbi:MAG: hypothetical protein ACP5PV_06435 [Methanothrix sp.]